MEYCGQSGNFSIESGDFSLQSGHLNGFFFFLAQMLFGVIVVGVMQFYSMSTVTTVVDVVKTPDPTEMCIDQIKNVSQTAIKLETKFQFIDVYKTKTIQLMSSLLNNRGAYYYLIEGDSKQGKSTFGQNLFNKLIQIPDVLALYLPLDEKDPENIFSDLYKCNWDNFRMATKLILRENQYVQIIIIVDNIQHAFKKDEIAAGLMSIFKNMKAARLNFLYISSQNSVIWKMKFFIFLLYFIKFLYSRLSGYGGTIEVINLKPELSSSAKKELSKIMNLNEKDLDRFLDMLGFNFLIMFDWLKLKEKKSLDAFIEGKIANRTEEINDVFENNADLKEKILGKEKIEKLKFRMEELDFLQKNNILIRTTDRKNAWHD